MVMLDGPCDVARSGNDTARALESTLLAMEMRGEVPA